MDEKTQDIQVDFALLDLEAANSRAVYEALAKECAWRAGVSPDTLLFHFLQADRDRAPGVGDGVAIPHLKIPGLAKKIKAFARLRTPARFAGPDDKPVDLLFLIVSPEEDGPLHLRRLSRVSRALRGGATLERLRAAREEREIRAILSMPEDARLAA